MRSERITSEFAWVVLKLAVFNLLGFLLIPLLTKTMQASAYGYWTQFQKFLQFSVPVVTLNLQGALVRFLPAAAAEEKDRAVSSVTLAVAALTILTSVAVWLARVPLAEWFFDGRADLVGLLAAVLPFCALNKLFYNYIRAERYIRLHSLLKIAERLLLIGLAAAFVWLGRDIFWVVATSPVSLLVLLIVLAYFVVRDRGLVAPGWDYLRRYSKFTVPLLLGGIGLTLVEITDRYLLAFFLDMDAVGTYSVAYTLGGGLKLVIAPFMFLLPAIISEQWDSGDESKVENVLSRSLKYYLMLFGLGISVLVTAGREILYVFGTRQIAAEAYAVLVLVAISYLMYGLWFLYSRWLYLTERTSVLGTMWAIAAAVNIVLNVFLIPRLGMLGAALGTLASYFGLGAWCMLAYRDRIQVRVPSGELLGMLVAVAGVTTALLLLQGMVGEDWVFVAVAGTAGPGVYVVLLAVSGVLDADELDEVRALVRRRTGDDVL